MKLALVGLLPMVLLVWLFLAPLEIVIRLVRSLIQSFCWLWLSLETIVGVAIALWYDNDALVELTALRYSILSPRLGGATLPVGRTPMPRG